MNELPEDVKQHLDKLQGFLESESLDIDGRIFVWSEIWDIRIEQKKAAMAGD